MSIVFDTGVTSCARIDADIVDCYSNGASTSLQFTVDELSGRIEELEKGKPMTGYEVLAGIPDHIYDFLVSNECACETPYTMGSGRTFNYITNWYQGSKCIYVVRQSDAGNSSSVTKDDLADILKKAISPPPTVVNQLESKEEVIYSMADEKYIYKLIKYEGDSNERSKHTKYQGTGSSRVKDGESKGSDERFENPLREIS